MQSAVGSLREAEITVRILLDTKTALWGVGSDSLSLSGHYEFQVLRGSILICGITLSVSDMKYIVNAPVAPYPKIQALRSHSECKNDHIEGLEGFAAVIKVVDINSTDLVELAPPYKQLWHNLYRYDVPLDGSNDTSLVNIPKSWKELQFTKSQLLVLGPKNSGKSSLARYASNQLLVRNHRVFYLDLDPGQPEYTVPGCLSLHELSELNFSPGYFHPDFRKLIRCYYLGYVSPVETPDRYLELCSYLFKLWSSIKQPNDKLVVNTPGWTKGLGLELNTSVAQMCDSDAEILHLGDISEFDFEYSTLEAMGDDSGTTITGSGYSSAELRSLQLMLYFHKNNPQHLTEWIPYKISLGDVGWFVLDPNGIDLKEDFAICIEGCVMAICICEHSIKGIISENADILLQNLHCVGMLVVQSIDWSSQSVNLLLPCSPDKLGLADRHVVLVRGRVNLPIWEFHNRKLGNSPWIVTTKLPGIGASYTKFRRNIQR